MPFKEFACVVTASLTFGLCPDESEAPDLLASAGFVSELLLQAIRFNAAIKPLIMNVLI